LQRGSRQGWARLSDPAVKVLFTSGYAETAIEGGQSVGLVGNLLSKPYRKEDLARKLREVLEVKEGQP
jgi:hypothetical protein